MNSHGFNFLDTTRPGDTEFFAESVDYDNGIMICARAFEIRYKIMTGHVEDVRKLRDTLNKVLSSMSTGFHKNRDHASLDSEIFALFDSIGADYIIKNGIVTVVTKYGDTWNFTTPEELKVGSAYRALFQTPAHEAHLVKRKNPQT